MQKKWFEEWFDSPYYHILYKNRDTNEAIKFINLLAKKLNLKSTSSILDLGCGKGRHSLQLNKHYNKVVGIDLSSKSILAAKKHESESLSFFKADMRNFTSDKKFNAIFNLFTSFGYFDDQRDNIRVLESCNDLLIKDGVLIIDYLNAEKIKNNYKKKEEKVIDGISFNIRREIINNRIVKSIAFEHQKKSFNFEEKVQLLTKNDFIEKFKATGFEIIYCWGNYKLQDFNPLNSDRLILVARKK